MWDIGEHSYFVGWDKDIDKVKKIADDEHGYRGEKYESVVYQFERGKSSDIHDAVYTTDVDLLFNLGNDDVDDRAST